MTPDLTAKLSRIRAVCERVIELAEKATPGPWIDEVVPTSIGHCHKIEPITACLYVDHRHIEEKDAKTQRAKVDSDFIAFSRTFTPAAARAVLDDMAFLESIADTRAFGGAGEAYHILSAIKWQAKQRLESLAATFPDHE